MPSSPAKLTINKTGCPSLLIKTALRIESHFFLYMLPVGFFGQLIHIKIISPNKTYLLYLCISGFFFSFAVIQFYVEGKFFMWLSIFVLPLLFGVHLCLSVPVSGVCLIFPLSLFFGTLHSVFPAFLSYWLSALVVRSCFWFLLNRQFQCSVQDSSSLFSNLAVCVVSNIGNKS